MRITCVISSMGPGGAERVMSMLTDRWVLHNHGVTLITLDSTKRDFFKPHPDVVRVGLGVVRPTTSITDAIRTNISRVRYLRAMIERSDPDIVISFGDTMNVMTLMATRKRFPTIVSERIDPRHQKLNGPWELLRRVYYGGACAVVSQTAEVADYIEKKYKVGRSIAIPNPVRSILAGDKRDSYILGVGRLHRQKGFDLLIRAYAKIRRAASNKWRLRIIGDGPEKPALMELAKSLHVGHSVEFLGQRQVYSFMRSCGMFVLPSRYEGFPNVLLEAMSCCTPVISSNCKSGPSEIITNGRDGLLVPTGDVRILSDTMRSLMMSRRLRDELGNNAITVRDRYRLETIGSRWDEEIRRHA